MPETLQIILRQLTPGEGGGWLGEVPAMPGCMGDGETPEEALADVKAAMMVWVDVVSG